MLPKLRRGINLPDIRRYNLASLVRHSIDRAKNTDMYSNVQLESALVYPRSLTTLLHTKFSPLPRPIHTSLIKRYHGCMERSWRNFQTSILSQQTYVAMGSSRICTGCRGEKSFGCGGMRYYSFKTFSQYTIIFFLSRIAIPRSLALLTLSHIAKLSVSLGRDLGLKVSPNLFDPLLGSSTERHL